VSNDSQPAASSMDSQAASGVGQTANIGRSTSVGSGAAKVFREFKWGLFTLFLLMVVVIGLVYDGGRKKKQSEASATPLVEDRGAQIALDGPDGGAPPVTDVTPPAAPAHAPVAPLAEVTAPPLPATALPGQPSDTPVAATPPITPAPATPALRVETGAEKTYTVKSGDTLTSIASSQLPGKGGLKAILESNKTVLSNPNKLRVGMTLKIPASVAAIEPAKVDAPKKIDPAAPAETASIVPSEYTVQSGDTLERIARKIFNDGRKWKELYEWNRDQLPDPSRLRLGQVLKIKQASAPASSARAELPEPTHTIPNEKAEKAKEPEVAADNVEPQVQVMSANAAANFP